MAGRRAPAEGAREDLRHPALRDTAEGGVLRKRAGGTEVAGTGASDIHGVSVGLFAGPHVSPSRSPGRPRRPRRSLATSAAHAKVTKAHGFNSSRRPRPWCTIGVSPPAAVTSILTGAEGGPVTLESKEAKALHEIALEADAEQALRTAGQGRQRLEAWPVHDHATPTTNDAPFRFPMGTNRTDDAAHAGRRARDGAGARRARDSRVTSSRAQRVARAVADVLRDRGPAPRHAPSSRRSATHEPRRRLGHQLRREVLRARRRDEAGHLDHTFRWGNALLPPQGISQWKRAGSSNGGSKALGDADTRRASWRVVVVQHHGPWSSDPHGGNPRSTGGAPGAVQSAAQGRRDPLRSRSHLSGRRRRLPFVVTGGGGAPLYRPEPHSAVTAQRVDASLRAGEVNQRVMRLTAVRPDGSDRVLRALRKGQGLVLRRRRDRPGPGRRLAARGRAESASTPTPTSRCSCEAAVGARTARGRARSCSRSLRMRGVVSDTERMRSAPTSRVRRRPRVRRAGRLQHVSRSARAGATRVREEQGGQDARDPARPRAELPAPHPERAGHLRVRQRMTDLSLGYKADARHWLAVANAYEAGNAGSAAGRSGNEDDRGPQEPGNDVSST